MVSGPIPFIAVPLAIETKKYADGVAAAYQLGRLDLVTALLAIVAIGLAIGVIPIFAYVRSRARKVANEVVGRRMKKLEPKLGREAATKAEAAATAKVEALMPGIEAKAVKDAEASAIRRVEAMLPTLVSAYMATKAVSAEEADQIANAQEGQADDNNV